MPASQFATDFGQQFPAECVAVSLIDVVQKVPHGRRLAQCLIDPLAWQERGHYILGVT
jgi:hypothetical protein